MKFGSVCSGIEAASVAWHPLGWSAAWLAEIEPFPSAVLAHYYPDVPNLGDMTTLPERITSGEVEAPDVFCGGTPCQAFSVAGLRKSLDDARGNLSLTFCEIANAIDTVRTGRGDKPAIIFLENVPGVLSTKDNAFGCFLAGLTGEDGELQPPWGKWTNAGVVLGPQRAVAWRVLDAQYFGVAQRRRRVFVVASARNDFDPAAVLFEFDGMRRDTAPSREARKEAAASAGAGAEVGGTFACGGIGSYASASASATLLKSGQDLGPGCETIITMAHGQGGAEIGFDRGPTPTCNHEAPIAAYPMPHTDCMPTMASGASTEAAHNARSGHTKDAYIVPVATQPIAFHPTQDPINSTEVFHSIGANSNATAAVAQPIAWDNDLNASVDQMGTLIKGGAGGRHEGVAQPISYGIRTANTSSNGWGIQEEITHTLKSDHGRGASDQDPHVAVAVGTDCFNGDITGDVAATMGTRGSSQNASGPTVMQYMQVRRLTPVECERLQGFPDNYTAIPWRKKPATDCPDGPRYKALGNSWAVPVVRWIGGRIQAAVMSPANDNGQRSRDRKSVV